MMDVEKQARKMISETARMYGGTCSFQRTDDHALRARIVRGSKGVAFYFQRYAAGDVTAHMQGVQNDLHLCLVRAGIVPETATPQRTPHSIANTAPVRHLGPIGEKLRGSAPRFTPVPDEQPDVVFPVAVPRRVADASGRRP